MKIKIIGFFVITLLIGASMSVVGNVLISNLLYYDVGVGEPTNIHDGDYRFLGEDSLFVTVRNYGDLTAKFELNFTLERLEGLVPIEILDEGFEDPLFPPDGWQVHHDGNQYPWQRDTIIGHESSACAGLFTIWPPTPPMTFDEWLVTDSYDFSEVTSLMLSVWYYGHANMGLFTSNLEIWASTDGGTTPDDFMDTGILLEEINPDADEEWIPETMDLSPLEGDEDVHLAFRFVGEENDFIEFFIDDILIEGEVNNWDEIDSQSKGPYDLDPDVWIESFFDVYYDFEGEYRATFSLDTPLRGDWIDDNPDNDVYQAVFTVIANNPPNTPTIDGPTKGTVGVTYYYNISATDPDSNDVYFYIEWFQGCPGIYWQGPYPSGEQIQFGYTWENQGVHIISVKAKDVYEAESETVTLTVTMPRTRTINNPFRNLLESHPNLFPILQRLLRL